MSAWIETRLPQGKGRAHYGRTLMSAWIETPVKAT